MRRRLVFLLPVLLASVARADPRSRHVYVTGLTDGDVAALVSPTTGEPMGVVANGEVLPPPTGGAQREDEAMLRAPPEAASGATTPPEVHPDRMTSTVTSTDYYEAFTPAIAPYKRVASYDALRVDPDGTPVLVVSNPESQAVSILGASPPSAGPRDAFWGTVMLDFRRGAKVALPSVAPDARILHARSEPAIDFVVEADVAGNFYVRSLEPTGTVVRFTFLTDAPRGFFGREPPDQSSNALERSVPTVPTSVRERGLRFAAELGISPSTPVRRSLDVLVEHFRGFVEAASMPSPTGDTYLDLARGGVGVCRHRSYAFVVTALSLGIPAMYVQNEAHAWVEVRLADGFLRIDLGGSARGVNAHGLQDRPKHEIAAADPFPEPEVFVRDYLERGVAPEQEPRMPGQGDDPSGGGQAGNPSSQPSSSGMNGGSDATNAANGANAANAPSMSADTPNSDSNDPSSASQTGVDDDPRTITSLMLDTQTMRVYRGQMLDVAGMLVDDAGTPVAQGRVEIRVGEARLLGVALTDAAGRFSVSLGIPPELGVGRHPLRVDFVGNRDLRPARAL